MTDSTTATVAAETAAPAGPDRRTFLKGVAIAGVTVPLAAACGSSDDSAADPASTPPTGDTTPPQTTDPATGDGSTSDVLTPSSDVPVGGGVILAEADTVVTQPTKGAFAGFSATCTHRGCTLANVSDGTINCTCHGSKFSIEDGSVVNGPATSPLPTKPVRAEGADIVAG